MMFGSTRIKSYCLRTSLCFLLFFCSRSMYAAEAAMFLLASLDVDIVVGIVLFAGVRGSAVVVGGNFLFAVAVAVGFMR